jgi:hypothetical protein
MQKKDPTQSKPNKEQLQRQHLTYSSSMYPHSRNKMLFTILIHLSHKVIIRHLPEYVFRALIGFDCYVHYYFPFLKINTNGTITGQNTATACMKNIPPHLDLTLNPNIFFNDTPTTAQDTTTYITQYVIPKILTTIGALNAIAIVINNIVSLTIFITSSLDNFFPISNI